MQSREESSPTAYNPHIISAPGVRFRDPNAFRSPQHLEEEERVQEHMAEISGDPSGSDPSLYLPQEDVRTLENFVKMADDLGWPNSTDISMKTRRYEAVPQMNKIPVWHSSKHVAKAALTKRLFLKQNETYKGYVFGYLSLAKPPQTVAICSDGNIRSLRGAELRHSNGLGWGKLPDPELMDNMIAASRHVNPVHYGLNGSEPLASVLKSRIPWDISKNTDFEKYGLSK
jgi:hypothetical protein